MGVSLRSHAIKHCMSWLLIQLKGLYDTMPHKPRLGVLSEFGKPKF